MKEKEIKTNVMRILEQKKISYLPHEYPHGAEAVDGVTVAKSLGQNPESVFKTLVTKGASGAYCVFVVPVARSLDLKKAAKAAGEKSVEMIKVSDITAVTGYVRGGCSPVGMKKQFLTVFHQSCRDLHTIVVSAGKIGYQIECEPQKLLDLVRAKTADIIVEKEGTI